MILKENYNLLTQNTASPISLSTSGGNWVWSPIIIDNKTARKGILYLEASGYASTWPGPYLGQISPRIYESHNKTVWFLNSEFLPLSTAKSSAYPLDNLGRYLRFSYLVNASCVAHFRANLELDAEY